MLRPEEHQKVIQSEMSLKPHGFPSTLPFQNTRYYTSKVRPLLEDQKQIIYKIISLLGL